MIHALIGRVGDVGVLRIHRYDPRLTAAGIVPRGDVEHAIGAARTAGARVVLLCAADAIREVVRRDDVVELPGGIASGAPALALVDADARTLAGGDAHPVRTGRLDPQETRFP